MSTKPFWFALLPNRFAARLQRQAGLLAIVHNTGWLFADKALRMGLGVLVGAWLARYLGPSQFGEISYILSFVAFFGALAQLGLDGVAVRDMARNEGDSPEILGTVLRLRLFAGFASWGLAILIMKVLRPTDGQALLLIMIAGAALVLQAADTVDLWFQSKVQSKRTIVSKTSAYLVASSLKIFLIVTKSPLVAFMFVSVAELAISAAILWWSYRQYPAERRWRWQNKRAFMLLREGVPYLLAGLAVMIYMRIDQLMLRSMVGDHELGVFSAALPLSTALYFVPMALCTSVAPMFARLRQRDLAAYEEAVSRLFSVMWWVMIPLAGIIALLSSHIVALLYGTAFTGSAPILAIHVFSSLPVALGVAQSLWIVNEGKNMISLYRTVIGALSNIGLNLLLIPHFGGVGAALAAVVAQIIAAVISNIVLAPRIFRLQLFSLVNIKMHPSSK